VLDHGKVHEGEQGLTEEVIEVERQGVSGELGLDAGAEAADGLGAVPLPLELLDELTVDGLDDLSEGYCQGNWLAADESGCAILGA